TPLTPQRLQTQTCRLTRPRRAALNLRLSASRLQMSTPASKPVLSTIETHSRRVVVQRIAETVPRRLILRPSLLFQLLDQVLRQCVRSRRKTRRLSDGQCVIGPDIYSRGASRSARVKTCRAQTRQYLQVGLLGCRTRW